MGLLTVCPLLFLLPFAISIKDDRLPCWWKTACNVACRQVTWFYSRVLYSPRKKRIENEDMVDRFCESTIKWAMHTYDNPTQVEEEDFCNYLVPLLAKDPKLHYLKGYKKVKKSDLIREYYHQIVVATMIKLCQETVCKDTCSDGKKQRISGMKLR
ncbi:unnamed protein product [Cylicocyclus nassatus]|uniref:Uncharacterized protein n=1 Tax=Cylicocyclus nassatus TaxID=53992 RepID=A0AA36GIK7_CYLNA|nr:unnamed protein product [Cylicocyclus nassatus]